MKEDYDEDEKTTLISYVNKSDRWIIDSGCSNHITSDRSKFEDIEPYKVAMLNLVIMFHVL